MSLNELIEKIEDVVNEYKFEIETDSGYSVGDLMRHLDEVGVSYNSELEGMEFEDHLIRQIVKKVTYSTRDHLTSTL